jgi:hypothetical protein
MAVALLGAQFPAEPPALMPPLPAVAQAPAGVPSQFTLVTPGEKFAAEQRGTQPPPNRPLTSCMPHNVSFGTQQPGTAIPKTVVVGHMDSSTSLGIHPIERRALCVPHFMSLVQQF